MPAPLDLLKKLLFGGLSPEAEKRSRELAQQLLRPVRPALEYAETPGAEVGLGFVASPAAQAWFLANRALTGKVRDPLAAVPPTLSRPPARPAVEPAAEATPALQRFLDRLARLSPAQRRVAARRMDPEKRRQITRGLSRREAQAARVQEREEVLAQAREARRAAAPGPRVKRGELLDEPLEPRLPRSAVAPETPLLRLDELTAAGVPAGVARDLNKIVARYKPFIRDTPLTPADLQQQGLLAAVEAAQAGVRATSARLLDKIHQQLRQLVGPYVLPEETARLRALARGVERELPARAAVRDPRFVVTPEGVVRPPQVLAPARPAHPDEFLDVLSDVFAKRRGFRFPPAELERRLSGLERYSVKELEQLAADIAPTAEAASNAIPRLLNALGRLTDKQRRVVELHYGFGEEAPRGVSELARELGVTHHAVQDSLARALKALRRALGT